MHTQMPLPQRDWELLRPVRAPTSLVTAPLGNICSSSLFPFVFFRRLYRRSTYYSFIIPVDLRLFGRSDMLPTGILDEGSPLEVFLSN